MIAPRATAAELHRRVVKHLAAGKSVVVDGVRSEAEAAELRRMGRAIWRLDNGKAADPDLPMDQRQAAVKADAVIDSRGRKKEIRHNVDAQLMRAIGAP